jgi:hypothetical protein
MSFTWVTLSTLWYSRCYLGVTLRHSSLSWLPPSRRSSLRNSVRRDRLGNCITLSSILRTQLAVGKLFKRSSGPSRHPFNTNPSVQRNAANSSSIIEPGGIAGMMPPSVRCFFVNRLTTMWTRSLIISTCRWLCSIAVPLKQGPNERVQRSLKNRPYFTTD